MAETPDDGRDTASFSVADRTVVLTRPSSGQMFIIAAVMDIADEPDEMQKLEAVNNFGTVLRYLFVQPADRQAVLSGLARGDIDLEEYFGLARDMLRHWAPEQLDENREERRAVARKAPARKPAARRTATGGRR